MLAALSAFNAIWQFAKRIPAWAYACILGVLALLAVWAWHNSQVTEAATEGRKAGATEQRESDLTETITRTEQANETREVIQGEVRSGTGGNLYAQCVRTARTPAHCQRFLPSGETPNR